MICRTLEELIEIPRCLGKAYMAGYQDSFDGKAEASQASRH